MRSSAAPPASADCSTYSPDSRGLRPSFRVFTRGYLPRFVLSGAARRASLGVSCPSAHARLAGPLTAGLPHPATFRPQGFPPSRRLSPRAPSRPCFMPERSWASPSRVLLLRVRRYLLRGPSPPRRWLPAGCALLGGLSRAQSFARPASPSSGLPVPGVRTLRPAVRLTPMGSLPSWASSSLRLFRHPPRRPDLAAIPSWASVRPSGLRPAAAPALRGLRRRAA
jgi:hypothetical protein